MQRITLVTVLFALFALSLPATAQDKTESQVSITATIRTYVLEAPRANAELIGILQSGVKVSAFGRDADADWLRIMDGWVLGEVFNTVGEVGALPDATHSFIGSTNTHSFLYDGPSKRWFNSLAGMGAGTQLLIIGRNEDSTWLQVPGGWVDASHVDSNGDFSRLPVAPSGVIITANTRTFILAEPDLSAEFVDVFEAGDEALAIGRAGDWLQIAEGWVSAEAVEASGGIESLPFAGEGLQIVIKSTRRVRNSPSPSPGKRASLILDKGDIDTAIGRSADGTYIQVKDGWILVGTAPSMWIEWEGNILDLPITDGSFSLSATSARPTATPRPATRSTSSSAWSTSTIRSLVSRLTDDIRILDLDIASAATTIEYDLKPWPFVPNEQIANEVAFKIICALRRGQNIPSTLKLIGQGHFKSDIGRKFKSPSVEIHISARRANSIICAGNDYSDINWRSVSSLYKSYPIPRGASVDYD